MTSFIIIFNITFGQMDLGKKKSNNKNKKTQSGWVFVSGFFFIFVLFLLFLCLYFFSNTVTMQKCKKTTRYFNRFKSHNIKRLRVCS